MTLARLSHPGFGSLPEAAWRPRRRPDSYLLSARRAAIRGRDEA